MSEEGPAGGAKASQSPLGPVRRKPHALTPRHSERNIGGIAEGLSAMGGFGMAPGGMLARDKEKERFKIGGLGKSDTSRSRDFQCLTRRLINEQGFIPYRHRMTVL